ncbi:hypothetical protein B0T22DRAFT_513844 [Podospora appendiculata]|uniref:Uncharacterized protein n=1 Tax=Podospora appendiculata TaxID=314037 RepID=A0AAE0XBZ9_9PEZI|nr:hypothetical protein B0T22DRAFT_513844 [Podospora appendiculata]
MSSFQPRPLPAYVTPDETDKGAVGIKPLSPVHSDVKEDPDGSDAGDDTIENPMSFSDLCAGLRTREANLKKSISSLGRRDATPVLRGGASKISSHGPVHRIQKSDAYVGKNRLHHVRHGHLDEYWHPERYRYVHGFKPTEEESLDCQWNRDYEQTSNGTAEDTCPPVFRFQPKLYLDSSPSSSFYSMVGTAQGDDGLARDWCGATLRALEALWANVRALLTPNDPLARLWWWHHFHLVISLWNWAQQRMDPISAIGVAAASLQLADAIFKATLKSIGFVKDLRDIPDVLRQQLGDTEKTIRRFANLRTIDSSGSHLHLRLSDSQAATLRSVLEEGSSAASQLCDQLKPLVGEQEAQPGRRQRLETLWKKFGSVRMKDDAARSIQRIQRLNDEINREMQCTGLEFQAEMPAMFETGISTIIST